jgi:hypothetical protein
MNFGFWPRIWAEYFSQPNFQGTPRSEALDSVGRNWYWWGPDTNWWQTQDNFSTRYTWPVSLAGGDCKICVDSDDGFRFYVDGQLKMERWTDSNWTSCGTMRIDQGWRTFRLEHYEHGGWAKVRMTWGRADGACYGTARPSTLASQGMRAPAYVTDVSAALPCRL